MRVVKVGGRAQADPRFFSALAKAWNAAPNTLCLVHGGGDEVSAMQRALGREAAFVGGRRVTSKDDIDLIRKVLSGTVNKRLVNRLLALGIPATGLSGEDSGLIGAEFIDRASLGFAGRPTSINAPILHALLKAGYLPVVSPVAYNTLSEHGGALNVNGDDAAAAIAAALEADELLLIADVAGVRDAQGEVVSTLTVDAALDLIENAIAVGGMAAKLESAHAALAAGVDRVRICDLAGLVDGESGTLITQSQSVVI